MVKAPGEAGIDMAAGLVNQIIVGVIPTEWKLCTIVNCCKGKGDSLKSGSYRWLKLTDYILRIADRIIKKFIRQHLDVDDRQLGFTSGCETTNTIFLLRQVQEKYLAKKKNLNFVFVDLEKAFDQLPRDVVCWVLWS